MALGRRGGDAGGVTACDAEAVQASDRVELAGAIELREVAKIFGEFAPLRRVSAVIQPGEIAVLLGENGSGKSTLLRLIAGLAAPTRGTVRVFGEDPREGGAAGVRERIAYVGHGTMLYDELSAWENLEYFRALRMRGRECRCSGSPETALRAVGLDHMLRRPVGQFSQGMRQRAALGCALEADPEVLLLDEPFSNLDVAGVRAMVALVADFRTWPPGRAGGTRRTVLLTTHQAATALPIADTVLTLEGGVLRTETAESYRARAGMA